MKSSRRLSRVRARDVSGYTEFILFTHRPSLTDGAFYISSVDTDSQKQVMEKEIAKAQREMNNFYDIERYDTNFLGDILTLI